MILSVRFVVRLSRKARQRMRAELLKKLQITERLIEDRQRRQSLRHKSWQQLKRPEWNQ